MKISMEGIGQKIITVYAAEGVKAGDLCKFSGNYTICAAEEGDVFCGKVVEVCADGSAAVQIGGYVEVPYSGTVTGVDVITLVAAENGSVCADEDGKGYLVVFNDTTSKVLGIIL